MNTLHVESEGPTSRQTGNECKKSILQQKSYSLHYITSGIHMPNPLVNV